jgi:type IV secretion system protein VirD4
MTTKVQFVLDEAASLGRLEPIDDAIDKYRAYGVRLSFFYQSIGQLRKCFPNGQDVTLLSNVTQVFFGVNDLETAEFCSRRLGEETIVVESGGTNWSSSVQNGERGQKSHSWSKNTSSNWQQQARKLKKPEEVMALDDRTAITFTRGVPPICTRLTRYYERRYKLLGGLWRAVGTLLIAFVLFALSAMVAFAPSKPSHGRSIGPFSSPFHHSEKESDR